MEDGGCMACKLTNCIVQVAKHGISMPGGLESSAVLPYADATMSAAGASSAAGGGAGAPPGRTSGAIARLQSASNKWLESAEDMALAQYEKTVLVQDIPLLAVLSGSIAVATALPRVSARGKATLDAKRRSATVANKLRKAAD